MPGGWMIHLLHLGVDRHISMITAVAVHRARSAMFYFLGILLALAVAYGLLIWLVRTDIGDIRRALKVLVPGALVVFAVLCALLGRPGLGAGLAVAAGFLVWRGRRTPYGRSSGKAPLMRSPWLELQIEPTSGGLEGVILAGGHEGKSLASLTRPELISLHRSLKADAESRVLLEAYLDSRAPRWRDDPQFDANLGQGVSPSPGAMADEEAYQILGLEPGASAADIRKAHRRLSQRMRGNSGSVLLLNRIDEARDVLLARHH